ncbi:MAG: hypothetical protein O9339_20660 [Rubrivivax sp.]|jgi:hypothetical protein|nr:hypothetical protein [Rubrivivax sp.]
MKPVRFLVGLVLIGMLAVGLYSWETDPCQDKKLAELASPDGRHVAVTFGRVCSMHEGMSTKVSVFSVDGDKSVFLGNAVTVDVIPGANPSPAGPGGGPTVWVAWTSPTQLSVTYSQRAKANKVSSMVGFIRVSHHRSDA